MRVECNSCHAVELLRGVHVLLCADLAGAASNRLDFISAFSAVVATMNNLGPGLGDVAAHYAAVSEPGKLILCLAMLMGRLEVFTLLVLLTPAFWRH